MTNGISARVPPFVIRHSIILDIKDLFRERRKKHTRLRRRHSRRGRVVTDGPAKIAAAVARHHRHRANHPAMARTRRGPNCRSPTPERSGVVCGIGPAGSSARRPDRQSATGAGDVRLDYLRGELDRLAAGNFKLGHCTGRPAAFAVGHVAGVAGISCRERRCHLPAGI